MAPHSGTLAWKIPWTEEPGGLQSKGSQRVGYDWATNTNLPSHPEFPNSFSQSAFSFIRMESTDHDTVGKCLQHKIIIINRSKGIWREWRLCRERKKTSKKQTHPQRDKRKCCVSEIRTGCFKNETIRGNKTGLLDIKNVTVKITDLVKSLWQTE